MKMFGNLTSKGLEEVGDRLGGGGIFDSAVYTGKVKLAYAGTTSGGAKSVTLHLDLGGKEYRETFYVTNKAGENFYPDKNDPKKKVPMQDFVTMNEICLVTTGVELEDQDGEEKVVNLYDFDLKKEVPTNVPMLTDLLGKDITVGILRRTVDKQVQGQDGKWVNSGQTKDENIIDKAFHAESGRTVTEIKGGMETAIFLPKWKEKNTGVVINRAKGGGDGKAGVPGANKPSGMFGGATGGASGAAKQSLFGPKA